MTKTDKIWQLLKQPSTHKGLIAILTAAGVALSPEHKAAIGAAGTILYGFYQVIRDEDKQIKEIK